MFTDNFSQFPSVMKPTHVYFPFTILKFHQADKKCEREGCKVRSGYFNLRENRGEPEERDG